MQGSKFNEQDREKVRQLLAAGKSVPEIVKETGVPRDTIYRWRKNLQEDENFQQLVVQKKEEFEKQASIIIEKASKLIERNLDRALKNGEDLDSLLEEYIAVCEEDDEELSKDKLKALFRTISNLRCDDLTKLSTTIGTMYDKRALSLGDSTENHDVRIVVSIDDDEQ